MQAYFIWNFLCFYLGEDPLVKEILYLFKNIPAKIKVMLSIIKMGAKLSYLCWFQLHTHHTGMCGINLFNSLQKSIFTTRSIIINYSCSFTKRNIKLESASALREGSGGLLQLRTPLFMNPTLQSVQAPPHRPVSLVSASIRWHLCFYMHPGNPPLSLCLRAFWHANDRQLVFIRVPFCSDWEAPSTLTVKSSLNVAGHMPHCCLLRFKSDPRGWLISSITAT